MADKKDSFVPYKYIKEFYNTERLILPAVRHFILNGVFLGGAQSTEKGDTLLDTVNYPIFDLWTFIINQYRYSFFETTRGELIVVPDMMSCLPPLCNVVFPDEYVHYGRNIDLRGITTRFFEQGFLTLTGNDSYYVDIDDMDKQVTAQQAFVAPTSDVEPLIFKVIAGECTPKEIPTSEEGVNFEAYTQIPLPEEFHYGATYKTGSGEYLSKMAEDYVRTKYLGTGDDSGTKTSDLGSDPNQDKDTEDHINLVEEYNDYHKLNVLYKYFLSRLYSQKTENIRLTFTPRLVVGLPILLLSRSGKHLLGLLTNLSHNISADGIAETIITVEYQYNYDDITKRPVYFYRQGGREKLKQESKNSEDESTYVWKNYYMLSAYFRDKYIGEKMYNNILCDGIDGHDFNAYAMRSLKDKSILGILNTSAGNVDLEILSKEQKKDLQSGKDPVRELDKAYFDQDRPNVSGEIQSIPVGSEATVELTIEMRNQQKKMAYAIEKIWAGYLSAYNKDVYRAKFDIYPLRDFDYWMRDLGASRQDNGNFLGNMEEVIDWVDIAEKEMEDRYKKYIKNRTEDKETKEKKIEDLNKEAEELLKKKKEKEEELDNLKKEEEIRNNAEKNALNQDHTKVDVPGLKYRSKTEIQSDIDQIEKERMNIEKEIESVQESIKELKSSVKMGFENWKKNYDILTFNEDYRKYDLGNRSFRTAGPFCLEKQEYFRDVYSKGLKEFHFDTEFRNFETNPQKKPKDIGNQIYNIVHRKGTGYNPKDDKNLNNSNSNSTKNSSKNNYEEKKKREEEIRKTREKTDQEMYQRHSNIKKYVAALWALTWGYDNRYKLQDNQDFIVINGKMYDVNKNNAVKHYVEFMSTKVEGLWAEPVREWKITKRYWVPVSTWEKIAGWFENYNESDYQYQFMLEMWNVYENLVEAKIINPAKPEDLK